jgi:hypothetical protein
MNSELVGCGSGCGILRYYSDTSLEGLRKTQDNFRKYNSNPTLDMDYGSPEYKVLSSPDYDLQSHMCPENSVCWYLEATWL